MRISIIGSGNVATHLALALYGRGHKIDQIWSRNLDHATTLAQRVEAIPIDDISQLIPNANVYILAVADDAIRSLAKDIRVGNALVLHTSGATPKEVLEDCSFRFGVLWSPQTFIRDVALEYNELPFCIEGSDPKTEDDIEEFIGMISQHIYHTNLQQRQYLHLSAVFVNNFTNGLYGIAQKICREHDVPFEILHPLVLNTARKVQWGDVRYQLTGPAVRNDTKTLAVHRKLLADDKATLQLYNRLTDLLRSLKND
jgi:predicted short-subunit dehydrogenase-like oxidoreductase (DUF2520 family)